MVANLFKKQFPDTFISVVKCYLKQKKELEQKDVLAMDSAKELGTEAFKHIFAAKSHLTRSAP